MATSFELEVDRNFEVFLEAVHGLLPKFAGQFALMRRGQISEFFASEQAALASGRERYPDGLFSIQEVTDRPVDLGFFSHAVNPRIA